MYTDGYNDNGDYYSTECEEDEMPATERELAEDAQWKVIQKNTFTRWTNEHLKQANKSIASLEADLADGLRLCALIEVLSGEKFKRINKRPNFRSQKLENVTTALKFLEEHEGIKIVNIDSTDIVDSKLKLILGLIWTLILHYSISMPMWEGEEDVPGSNSKEGPTPKQRMLIWVQNRLPDVPVRNFTTDWNDGRAIGALVDAVGPGLCPDWEDWDPNSGKKNATEAMDLAEEWLDVPQLIKPDEMTNPKIDELSMMTYLSQFPNAKLKAGAPLRPRTNAARVRAYGPGLEPAGVCALAPARFTVETFSAGRGEITVQVINAEGNTEEVEVVFNNDRNLTYSCSYTPSMEGQYTVTISFAGKEIPKSPYKVTVEGAAGDPEKVTAEGPGLEASGVQAGKKTYFEVFTEAAGVGNVEVVIVDSHGHKDSCRPRVSKSSETTHYVEYMAKEVGRYSVHIYFAGKEVPYSPYTVNIGAPVEPKKAYATGRGLQAKGVRVEDVADIMVHTGAAGEAELTGTLIGPTEEAPAGDNSSDESSDEQVAEGPEEPLRFRKIDANTYEASYKPTKPGHYTVNLQYGSGHIAKSPFKVSVGPFKESKIRAYGPGLEGGIAGKPADFVVETNGETGALGFAIEGPSQAKIQCSDNGDGSADVTYMPTTPGEYAVHVLCDNEDIPKSPFMSMVAPALPQGNGDMIVPEQAITAESAPNGVFESPISPDAAQKAHSMLPNGGYGVDFDPTEVVASGPGLEKKGVTQGKPAVFTVDTSKAGNAPLKVYGQDVNGTPINVQTKDNGDGTYSCQYNPKEPIKHTVFVTFGGVNVPKSPFRVYVEEPSMPENVKVFGPGIEPGVTCSQRTHFFVDCTEAGPGDVAISLTDDKGIDVPVDADDNGEGLFRIEYEPETFGTYTVNVLFADCEIPSSPYTVKIEPSIDVSGVKVAGLEKGLTVNKLTRFQVYDGSKVRKLFVSVVIRSPSGKALNPMTNRVSDATNVSFTPREVGVYSIEVYANGKPIIGSPFNVSAVSDGSSTAPNKIKPPRINFANPNQVKQPAIEKGKPWSRKPSDNRSDCEEKAGKPKGRKPHGNDPDGKHGKFGKPQETTPDWMNPHLKGVRKKSLTPVADEVAQPRDVKVQHSLPEGESLEVPKLKPWQKKKPGNGKQPQDTEPSISDKNKTSSSNLKSWQKNRKDNNVSKMKVYGDGILIGHCSEICKFTVDTAAAGPGELGFAIYGPGKATLTPKDVGFGRCEVSYIPTLPGLYSIEVTYNKAMVPGAPFKPTITTQISKDKGSKASMVKAYGEGLKETHCNQEALFIVDASTAGPGKLGLDIKGPSQPTFKTKDIGGGNQQVAYTPTVAGQYNISVTYDGFAVCGSPFKPKVLSAVNVDQAVNVYGDGIERGEVGKPAVFIVDTTVSGPGKLGFDIRGPSKPKVSTKDLEEGKCQVTYTPTLVGSYTVDVTYNGRPVPGAPFRPQIKRVSVTDSSAKVKVYGDGLVVGEAKKSNVFIVDTQDAGPGKLNFDIRGPSKPQIMTKDIEPGKCEITYVPTLTGVYIIDVTFNSRSVPGAPFQAHIKQAASRFGGVKVTGDGLLAGETNKPNTFVVDKTEAGPGKLDFDVTGPIKPTLTTRDIDTKKVEVTYTPTLRGSYTINVRYNGKHVAGSPFKPNVKLGLNSADPLDKVIVSGEGISKYRTNHPCTFTVDTTASGPGKLSFNITGPRKPQISTKEIEAGKCEVTYTPTVVGSYAIDVRYDGKSVPGAPFKPNLDQFACKTAVNANKVKVYGDGISTGDVNKLTTFIVDTQDAGHGKLDFDIKGPSNPRWTTKEIEAGKYEVTYLSTLPGLYTVDVTFDGKPVPGAPFKPNIKRPTALEAHKKVKVYGDGITKGLVNKPNSFVVDTTVAGSGKLGFEIYGPSKPHLTTQDIAVGKCEVTYTPSLIGPYSLNITFDGKPVVGAPYKVEIVHGSETAKASMVKVYGNGVVAGTVCQSNTFLIDTTESGPGEFGIDILGPSSPTITTKDIGFGKCEVMYTVDTPGLYSVCTNFNGTPIPNSPFKVNIFPGKEGNQNSKRSANVKVYGDGMTTGKVGVVSKFIVDTSQNAPGELGFDIRGPGQISVTTQNIGNGQCEVSYVPTEAGAYAIHVTYNQHAVLGSPFSALVEPNLEKVNGSSMVKVHGNGLTNGEVNKCCKFLVDTTESGPGKLSFDLRGPSNTPVHVKEITPEQYEVSYIPSLAGEYLLDVLFDEAKVSGSPFFIQVTPNLDENSQNAGQSTIIEPSPLMRDSPADTLESLCPVTGVILQRRSGNVIVKMPVVLIVDTSQSGTGKLDFALSGPAKAELVTTEIGEGVYELSYVPITCGDYVLDISYDNTPLSTAPVCTSIVTKDSEMSTLMQPLNTSRRQCSETMVILSGGDLECGKCGQLQSFVVDTSVSGPGKLAFEAAGPSKLDLSTKSLNHDKCEVTYTPSEVGIYTLNVIYNDRLLSICPLRVDIMAEDVESFEFAQGEVTTVDSLLKCSRTNVKLSDCTKVPVCCGRVSTIIVDMKESGRGKLECSLRGPAEANLSTVDLGGEKCEIRYLPTVPGEYNLDVIFNGEPLAISPLHQQVVAADDVLEMESVLSTPVVELAEDIPRKECVNTGLMISGHGINVGKCNQVSSFLVDTEKAGTGELRVEVNGPSPSSARVITKPLSANRYTVTYTPSTAGMYTIHIFYGNKQAFGGSLLVEVSPLLHVKPLQATTKYSETISSSATDDKLVTSNTTTSIEHEKFQSGSNLRQEKRISSTITSVISDDISVPISIDKPSSQMPMVLPSSVTSNGNTTVGQTGVQSPIMQCLAVEEVIESQVGTAQSLPPKQPAMPSVDSTGIIEDVFVALPIDTCNQEVVEEQITFTNKLPAYSARLTEQFANSEFTLSLQSADAQLDTENVESCFTISANTILEDSYNVTNQQQTTYPVSTNYNIGGITVESSSDITEHAFISSSEPSSFSKENMEVMTSDNIESSFTISADAIIEESSQNVSARPTPLSTVQYESDKKEATQQALSSSQLHNQDLSVQTEMVNVASLKSDQTLLRVESVTANIEAVSDSFGGATPKVNVTGDCLTRAVVNETESFIVDMSKSGPGNLNVSVTGPAKPELLIKDIGDSHCQVTFVPKVMGSYLIAIMYNGEHVPGSPFTTYVTSQRDLVVASVELHHHKTDVFLDSTTDFTVDASSVTPNGEGNVRAIVTGPSGAKNDTKVTNNGDGTYQVAYAPYEEGPHQIDVNYEGIPIPGSPLEVEVVPGNDPSRVKVYGPGLEKGLTNVPQKFTIETKSAGQGGLALAVEGPSKAQVNCIDNHDGTCSVDYTPTKPGDYDIIVKFDGEQVPGSPFKVPVEDVVDPSKVRMYGPGLNPEGVRATQPAPFTIDCKDAGKAPLKATVDDGTGSPKPVEMVEVDEGVFECTYHPSQEGAPCRLDVTYDDEHVPGSPFEQTVLPAHDASLVTVNGPGVEDGAPASLPTEFTVDTSKAGVADLDVAIQTPDGRYLRPNITDNKDATVTVHYTPDDVGAYSAKVKYGGDPIPGSPFEVNTRPTGDASKCQITEGKKRVVVDEECVITVNTADAGLGNVTCRIRTPTDTDADIDIVDNNDGTVSIFYTPHTPGNYGISIKFGGVPIPEGDYEVEAVPEELFAVDEADIIAVQKVNGLHSAPPGGDLYPDTFHPVNFVIPVGPIFAYVLAEVESPSGKRSPVKISDNGDGTVTINYQPSEVGLHNLHVFYNDEPLEGSPYKFYVDEVDSPVVAAYGPGLSYGVASEPCSFTIDTKNSGAGGIKISLEGPKKAAINLQDNGDNTITVSFTPEVPGTYMVTVSNVGQSIRGSPFICKVLNAAGGLSLAVEGPSKAEIVCQDNDDGTCTVTYLPTEPGLYDVVVKFDDEHIMGSPFTAYIAGETNKEKAQLSMGQASEFSLSVEEYDINELEADITTPSGKSESCILKKLPNGHLGISFTPHETGTHLVNVYKDGQHIPNSPFKINVTRNEVGHADKVKVYGDGLTSGTANDINEFYVDTKDAGYGGLSLSIEGPSKADIDCKDRPDGSTAVNYKPTQPGTYVISIKFADEHVPGSPFNCKVGGTTGINEESMLTTQQKAADVTHVGSVCELSLKVPGSDPMEMVASVTSPSGITELCDVMDSTEDHYTIQFVPKEMGPHIVSVKHKGLNIPGSPFQFTVGPITEGGAHKVHASGPGLERGEIEVGNEFNIYTREAGSGGLAISVEGPSKADIKFEDKHDGSSVVSYRCTDPGEYVVSVKFNDEHIPDSPFRVPILPSSGDARKVTVQSLKQKGLEIGKPASFTCQFNGASGSLFAKVVAPSGAEDEAICQSLDDSSTRYAVRFIPRENGVHFVHVTLDNCHIRGSPFKVIVGEQEPDPGVVTASGEGLRKAETDKNNKFTVHTVGAGSSSLAVTIDGPSKAKLDAKEIQDGYEFSYNPSAPGTYYVTIKYGGNHHIAGSPFKVKCTGAGQPGQNQSAHCVIETEKKTEADLANAMPKFNSDGSKVTSKGPGLAKAFVNKKAQFTVDSSSAGQNMLFVGMIGPANCPPVDEILIKHAQRNTYNVSYTVKQKGKYHLLVKWGDDHIPGSPFNIDVI